MYKDFWYTDLNKERQWSGGIGGLCITPGTGTLAIHNYKHLKIKEMKKRKIFLKKAFCSLCDQYGIALTIELHNRSTFVHYIIW